MKSDNKNKIGAESKSSFSRIDKIHPVKMLLYLCLGGVGVVFLFLLLAYARAEVIFLTQLQIPFPKFFSVSTILIMVSGYLLSKAPKYYRKDNLQKMTRYLGFSLLFGVAFVVSQVLAWYEIAGNGMVFTGKTAGFYLYLITALHALHVVGGILFLLYLNLKAYFASRDAIRTLIYIRDPFRTLQLTLLKVYWQFMAALWLSLYFVFLFLF